MKKLFVGAVSISALMLAAACGDSDNAYETSEADAVEQDADRTAANEEDDAYADAAGAQGAQSWDEENYRELEDRSPSERLPVTETAQAPGAAADPNLSKTRAEIEVLATEAFASADANGDGAIDQEEYVQLALASARDFDSFVTEPVKLMSVNPATDPQMPADDASDTAAADDAMPEETQDPAASSAQTAEAAPALDEAEAATIETAAAQTFEEAAGGDSEMTPEELRTAFLSRFDQADEDGDEELNATELHTFAALTRGEESAPADGNN